MWDLLLLFVTNEIFESSIAGFERPIGDGRSCFTSP